MYVEVKLNSWMQLCIHDLKSFVLVENINIHSQSLFLEAMKVHSN